MHHYIELTIREIQLYQFHIEIIDSPATCSAESEREVGTLERFLTEHYFPELLT